MLGAIRKRDILFRPTMAIRCFGWRVFLRTLVAGRRETFLSILVQQRAFHPEGTSAWEIVRRCVRLERHAKEIYQSLAKRFNADSLIQGFFATLARQEAEHEELLEMCRVAAMRSGWDGSCLAPLCESVPLVERQMKEADAKVRAVRVLADALWLTVEIESSEINRLFQAVVAATDSEFVREFKLLRSTVRAHLSYIQGITTTLEPTLRPACERMLACGDLQING
jgi:rubrerythrin